MKRAVVLKHVPWEGPARIAELLREQSYDLDIRALYAGDSIPAEITNQDLLIVMGGPMGVGDVHLPEYPFLAAEVKLLRQCIALDAPVLGVCLGAQLLAHAAGAAVYPMRGDDGSRVYEVGWGPIKFEKGSAHDDFLTGLPEEGVVLHWHGDTFDLPVNARRFASSRVCKNQGFRLGTRLFGLQFHVETNAQDVAGFIAKDADFLVQANGEAAVSRLHEETTRLLGSARDLGDRLLYLIIAAMTKQ
ncbi:MAG: gamma-glutamyl-gamma-aminobutyrate hydrolase family protein [Pseudomonadota bacterium]